MSADRATVGGLYLPACWAPGAGVGGIRLGTLGPDLGDKASAERKQLGNRAAGSLTVLELLRLLALSGWDCQAKQPSRATLEKRQRAHAARVRKALKGASNG